MGQGRQPSNLVKAAALAKLFDATLSRKNADVFDKKASSAACVANALFWQELRARCGENLSCKLKEAQIAFVKFAKKPGKPIPLLQPQHIDWWATEQAKRLKRHSRVIMQESSKKKGESVWLAKLWGALKKHASIKELLVAGESQQGAAEASVESDHDLDDGEEEEEEEEEDEAEPEQEVEAASGVLAQAMFA